MRNTAFGVSVWVAALAMLASAVVAITPATAGSLQTPGLSVGGIDLAAPLAMSPIPGARGSLVEPAQYGGGGYDEPQCQYREYCSYGNCYQRQYCYVCWYAYGRQQCGWRWQ